MLKVCVMDEAWRLIQHPTLKAYLQEALKTWRKRNAAVLLATQSVEDFASVDLLRTVVESCPTKLLLANPSLDRRQYVELFQMNEAELDLLSGLTPRQQVLLKRPGFCEGAHAARRPAQLLDLHQHADRQRTGGRHPPRAWICRRDRALGGVCVI